MPDVPVSPDAADDHATAHQLAREAGELLLDLRAGLAGAGTGGRAMGKEGDAAAHDLLVARLAELRPDDGVLSEEGVADEADDALATRLATSRVWIVDPLDGTREFGEPPRTDWAVHVALAIDGDATIGAVALPAQGVTLATLRAPQLTARVARPPRILVSRSRPPEVAEDVAGALGGELVPLGSAGAKAMAVVLGEGDAYVHAGGQYEWDSAAPAAVARAAGLHVSRLDGSPLVYNRADPYLPDLVICRPELADQVLTVTA